MGVDRVVVRPAVVRLPGVVAALEEDVGGAVVADDEDDVALPVRCSTLSGIRGEPAEIDAAGPVGGNLQFRRGLPAAFAQRRVRSAGPAASSLKRAEGRHETRAASAIIAHAKDFDLKSARRVGADHDLKRLAGFDALMRTVAFDNR